MKKVLFAALLMAVGVMANAQVKNPVKWTYSAKKIDPKTYELHMTATIESGWHIYTIDHTGDIGVATAFTINNNPLGSLAGKVTTKAKAISMKDPSSDEMVKFYVGTVDFVQTVKLKAAVKTNYTGEVEFMVCDDHQCLPPTTKTFSIALQ